MGKCLPRNGGQDRRSAAITERKVSYPETGRVDCRHLPLPSVSSGGARNVIHHPLEGAAGGSLEVNGKGSAKIVS